MESPILPMTAQLRHPKVARMTPPIHESNESGATAVEYAIMVSLIAAVIVAVVLTLGETIRDDFFQYVVDIIVDAL